MKNFQGKNLPFFDWLFIIFSKIYFYQFMEKKNTNKTHSSKPLAMILAWVMIVYVAALAFLLISNMANQKKLEQNKLAEQKAIKDLEERKKTISYKNFLMAKKIYELRTIPWYDSFTQLVNIKEQIRSKLGNKSIKEFVIDMNQVNVNWTVTSIDNLYKKDGVLPIFDEVLWKVYKENNLIKPTDSLVRQIDNEDKSDYNYALTIKLSNGTKK